MFNHELKLYFKQSAEWPTRFLYSCSEVLFAQRKRDLFPE